MEILQNAQKTQKYSYTNSLKNNEILLIRGGEIATALIATGIIAALLGIRASNDKTKGN